MVTWRQNPYNFTIYAFEWAIPVLLCTPYRRIFPGAERAVIIIYYYLLLFLYFTSVNEKYIQMKKLK